MTRKIVGIISIVCMMSLMVSSCKTTPEQKSVQEKDNEALMRAIEGQGNAKNGESENALSNEALFADIPEIITFNEEAEKLSLVLDAIVKLPEFNKIPIVEVNASPIGEQRAVTIINSILGNATLKQLTDEWTKEEILLQLTELQLIINTTPTEFEDEINHYKQQMKDLQKELESAPEQASLPNLELKYIRPTIQPLYFDGLSPEEEKALEEANKQYAGTPENYQIITGQVMDDNYPPFHVRVIEKDDPKYSEIIISDYINVSDPRDYSSLQPDENISSLQTTQKQACEIAEKLLEDAEIIDMELESIIRAPIFQPDENTSIEEMYILIYTPCMQGVKATFVEEQSRLMHMEEMTEESFESFWGQSYIQISINDSGIVDFYWKSPVQLNDSPVNTQVEIMPFDEILSIFKKQIFLQYSFGVAYEDAIQKGQIFIDRIVLGMMKVKKPDSDEYWYVPVWDFMGYTNHTWFQDNGSGETFEWPDKTFGQSFLTINAVDGTIINRYKEY